MSVTKKQVEKVFEELLCHEQQLTDISNVGDTLYHASRERDVVLRKARSKILQLFEEQDK